MILIKCTGYYSNTPIIINADEISTIAESEYVEGIDCLVPQKTTFPEAVEALKNGKCIKRGKPLYAYHHLEYIRLEGDCILTTNNFVYEFSWDDILAEDWMIVE